MNQEKSYLIRDVAIYLRKSRGEDVNLDLEKHRIELVEICEQNNWNYVEYAEIGTSDSIQDRPKFKLMLDEIKQELYDAVVVIDIDRLGRGDDEDWGKIQKVFRDNGILIFTPTKMYDLENDDDEMQLDFKKFLARMEYKQITKRLRRGKTIGAKAGKWTNGRPPFPYIYNRERQLLEVDKSRLVIYRKIIDNALQGFSAQETAWQLNKLGYKSPGGKFWSSTAVYRLLHDKTHMGKIVTNKQKGSGHINKKTKPLRILQKEDWIIADGFHEILKTEEEHNKILELFAKRKIIPKASRRGAFILSGLVFCGKCGHSMQFTFNGNTDIEYVKKCQYADEYGNRCGNRGVDIQDLLAVVFSELKRYEEEIKNKNYDVSEHEISNIRNAIEEKKKSMIKEEKALGTIFEMREEGEITKEIFLLRKQVRESNLIKVRKEISELEERCNIRKQATDKKLLKSIEGAQKLWVDKYTPKQKNQFLRTIIDKIKYTREGDDLTVDINFL